MGFWQGLEALHERMKEGAKQLDDIFLDQWRRTKCEVDLPVLAWHYCCVLEAAGVARAGCLKSYTELHPDPETVTERTTKVVWFSTEQFWESQALWRMAPEADPIWLLDRGVTAWRFGLRTSKLYGPMTGMRFNNDDIRKARVAQESVGPLARWLANRCADAIRADPEAALHSYLEQPRVQQKHFVSLEAVPLGDFDAVEKFTKENGWIDARAELEIIGRAGQTTS